MPLNIQYSPAIVVVAYNRAHSLKRLLESLKNAFYKSGPTLVISIDSGDNKDVQAVANDFTWQHGEKTIICQKTNLGLRKHILKCGELTKQYGSIILLEDDLYVSPNFYEYARQALNFYGSDDAIAGISLYSHQYNETAAFPYIPLDDGSDVYFLQIPSSWGQAWTDKQWAEFSAWYSKNNAQIQPEENLPDNVLSWPESSWKFFFFKYLNKTNKYFVYPKISLSTNFSDDKGTHVKFKTDIYQVPLLLSMNNVHKYKFIPIEKTVSRYDSFCELLPESVKKMNRKLETYDFEMDLYGTKNLSKISSEFIITSKKSSNPIMSFGRALKPHDMNILTGIRGNEFVLTEIKNVTPNSQLDLIGFGTQFGYYYKDLSKYDIAKLFFFGIQTFIKNKLKKI